MATASGRSLVQSPHLLLAASAILDLVARLPTDLIVPAASLLSGYIGNPLVGLVTSWLVFTVAIYTLCPHAYTFLNVLPRETVGFRSIATIVTITAAYVLTTEPSQLQLLAVGLLTVFGGGLLFVAYLSRWHGWNLRDPDGKGVTVLEAISPHDSDVREEIRSDFAYEGWLGRIAFLFYLLAVGLVIGFPLLAAAFVIQFFSYAGPIPDLLFLGYALSLRTIPKAPVGPGRGQLRALEFDLEKFLLVTIRNATRSIQGLFMVIFVLLGLINSAGYLFVAVGIAPQLIEVLNTGVDVLVTEPSLEVGLILWRFVGAGLLLLFGGLYGIWAWVRELQRLPKFLDSWEGREDATDLPLRKRPVGFVVPPAMALLLAAGLVAFDSQQATLLGGVLWPLVVLTGGWAIVRMWRIDPQPVTREHAWITGGLIVQAIALAIAGNAPGVLAALRGEQSLTGVLALPFWLVVLILLVAVVPVASRYDSQHSGIRQYTMVGLVVGVGIISAGSMLLIPDQLSLLRAVLAAACLVFGPLLGLVRYYDL